MAWQINLILLTGGVRNCVDLFTCKLKLAATNYEYLSLKYIIFVQSNFLSNPFSKNLAGMFLIIVNNYKLPMKNSTDIIHHIDK